MQQNPAQILQQQQQQMRNLQLTPQQQAAYQSFYLRHQQQQPQIQQFQAQPQQQQHQQQQQIYQQQQQQFISQAFQQHAQLNSSAPQQIYQEFMRMAMAEDWFLEGAHKNRLLLALQSHLPNEVDWAFNKLVLLSYLAPDYFVLNMIPGLIDAIIEHSRPFLRFMNSTILPSRDPNAVLPLDIYDTLFSKDSIDSEFTERILQIYHFFRNFSFVDPNVPILVSSQDTLKLVSYGLRATGFPKASEIRLYALDILENLSIHIKISENDPIFNELKSMLFENDRAIVMGSMRTLSKLVHLEHNEHVFQNVDSRIIQRLLQLLFVWDEELVASVMDLLYHYSCLYGSVTSKIASSIPTNIVKILMKFLEWRQHPRSSNSKPQPTLQNHVDPRQSCVEWLKNTYEVDANHAVNQMTFYGEYMKFCSLKKIQPVQIQDFLRLAHHCFPKTSAHVDEQVVAIRGIKPKVISIASQNEVLENSPLEAQKTNDGSDKKSDGNAMNLDHSEVSQTDNAATGDNIPKSTVDPTTQINNKAVPQNPLVSQPQTTLSHAQHINIPPQQQKFIPPATPHSAKHEQEMSSIPLTTALVLRNLAQSKTNHSLFLPYESDIAQYASLKSLHESVGRVLANILYELAKSD